MRKFCQLLILLLFTHIALAGDLRIISSGGFQGVADAQGKVVVPAIYEKLGWSNGSQEIVDQNVGFYENGKWGLINIKTRKIGSARYHLLQPFNDRYFEAGKMVTYSNVIRRGLIDDKGEVILDFHYYTISEVGSNHWLVSKYERGGLYYGIYNSQNQALIQCEYAAITKVGNLYIAGNSQRKNRVFNSEGHQVISEWVDRVDLLPDGYQILKDGYCGKLDLTGILTHRIQYKSVVPDVGHFNKWEIRSLNGMKSDGKLISCDSITYQRTGDLLIAHVNRAEHLLAAGDVLFEDQQNILKHIRQGFVVTKNTSLQSWSIHKTDGREVISGFDSIAVDSAYFYALSVNGWDVYNLFGRKINEYPFQGVGHSQNRNVPAKRNDFWGWVDFQGKEVISFRYEKVASTRNYNHFIAKNYNQWGVSTFADEWLIMPEFDSLYAYQNFYIGEKSRTSYVHDKTGKLLQRIPYPLATGDYLQLSDGDAIGAVTSTGFYIYPQFREIQLHGEYYELSNGDSVAMIYKDGRSVLSKEDGISDVLSFSEGFFHVIKDDKHGFVDVNGKLRVANRYDSAQYYFEGLAPVKLLGKWGYIDKSETLTIQPYYRHSSVFKNGLAVIQSGENYGIITPKGEEVVSVTWKYVKRLSTGNYLITDWDDKVGLVNADGMFVLRPNYEALEDTNKLLVIATQAGRKGVLNYQGYTKVPFQYADIQIEGDYLLLLKESANNN